MKKSLLFGILFLITQNNYAYTPTIQEEEMLCDSPVFLDDAKMTNSKTWGMLSLSDHEREVIMNKNFSYRPEQIDDLVKNFSIEKKLFLSTNLCLWVGKMTPLTAIITKLKHWLDYKSDQQNLPIYVLRFGLDKEGLANGYCESTSALYKEMTIRGSSGDVILTSMLKELAEKENMDAYYGLSIKDVSKEISKIRPDLKCPTSASSLTRQN